MIGNDVIDLDLARKESNWKRKGFLDKIFTSKEQLLISKSLNPEIMVWNLWSRKEAAYKIYNRQTQMRSYIPLQLECFDIEEKAGILYGKVICYDTIYFTKTIISLECIETIAVLKSSDFDTIQYLNSEVVIIKTNGIPDYYDTKNQVLKSISKSHHGRFEKLVTL
ncbi:4'-phosphopantetheinyl transferase superfamily protein [Flavobacterium sp.]|uniref:4'-phosphopantetheinyl transferase family protein n=1 Tax=Flavobacterium sp. TaxID=239 RepID=UPI00286A0627|nr:4'-phosphopantetheinyl transferase superfamily protein [Flavobacterium sp.]